jgi:ABC-type nickel/cobalt efflux system permease component RcnA
MKEPQPKRPAKLKALPPPAANAAPEAPLAVASAFKALHAGEASGHQQQIALQWLIREACGKAHFPYHQSERDTAFALGRYFVADLIVGLFNADLSSLRRDS